MLLNKNINFNKNETELKMENPTRNYLILSNYLTLHIVLNVIEYTFRKYLLLHIKKHYFIHFFLLVFKIVESLQCILKSYLNSQEVAIKISTILNEGEFPRDYLINKPFLYLHIIKANEP